MSILDSLTLSNTSKHRDHSPEGQARRKMLEAIDPQIAAATADLKGELFHRVSPRWITNEATGQRELRHVQTRFRRWWFKDIAGTIHLELRYANKALEIKPGKTAITVGSMDELLTTFGRVREAVAAGELDKALMAAVAGRRRELRLPNGHKPSK